MREFKHIGDEANKWEKDIILKGADVLSTKGFTQVPNHVLESGDVSGMARLTYSMLLKYAWFNDSCFPGQDRLAKDLACARTSVNAYIKELQEKGLIKVMRRGQGKTNIYELDLRVKNKRVDKSR
jgi:biotin operon repressor